MMNETPRAVGLTERGLAVCHFAFRDGPSLGLGEVESYSLAQELINEWDGSETLLQIYNRTRIWPAEVAE